jgi:predicted unusual protein kinase regulating ubiquinone biosynthesis (AarF/ABC1/UbiB family)
MFYTIFCCSFLFELQKLCDAVPGYPTKAAILVIESELGAKVADLFDDLTEDTRYSSQC